MDLGIAAGRQSVRLTSICGVGNRGKVVVRLLTSLMEDLPAPLKQAVRVVKADTADKIVSIVNQARSELVDSENTDRIQTAKWEIEGLETGALHVRNFVVSFEDDIAVVSDELAKLEREHSLDTVWSIRILAGAVEDDSAAGGRREGSAVRRYLVGHRMDTGEEASTEAVDGSVAAMLLMSIIPGLLLEPQPTAERAVTFGVAAFHGCVGPSRTQLAMHLAHMLLFEHAKPASELEPKLFERAHILGLIEAFSFRKLSLRLFDPKNFGGRTDPIPAVPEWGSDGELRVDLDENEIALSLGDAPGNWSQELRRASRMMDMTLAVRWRQQLDSACRTLCESVAKELVGKVEALLRTVPHSQRLARRVVEQLREDHGSGRSSRSEDPGPLERQLAALDRAVVARPDPLRLWLRTGVWVGPTLLGLGLVIHALYEDYRGPLFALVFAGVGALLAVGGVLHRLYKARRRILEARDRSTAALVGRQETILAQNVLDCLEDILRTLRGPLDNLLETIGADEKALEDALESLDAKMDEDVTGTISLQPVLESRDDYRKALARLNPDKGKLLEELGEKEGLSPTYIQTKNRGNAADWTTKECEEFLSTRELAKTLRFSELWEIRRQHRGETFMQDAVEAIRRRAVPLGKIRSGSEETLLVMPPSIELSNGEGEHEGAEPRTPRAVLSPEIPVLGCWRAGVTLPALKGS